MYTCNLDHKGSHRPAYCTGCSGPLADALVPAAERRVVGVACVVEGVWDLGGFELAAAEGQDEWPR